MSQKTVNEQFCLHGRGKARSGRTGSSFVENVTKHKDDKGLEETYFERKNSLRGLL